MEREHLASIGPLVPIDTPTDATALSLVVRHLLLLANHKVLNFMDFFKCGH